MSKRALYQCGCGCDKVFPGDAIWDGYHGPNYLRPVVQTEKEWTKCDQMIFVNWLFFWLMLIGFVLAFVGFAIALSG